MTFECTARLALLELESRRRTTPPAGSCASWAPLAEKLGRRAASRPTPPRCAALATVVGGEPTGGDELDDAVAALERIDARFLAPDVLGIVAEASTGRVTLRPGPAHASRGARAAADAWSGRSRARGPDAVLACVAAERARATRPPVAHLRCQRAPTAATCPVTWKGCARRPKRWSTAPVGHEHGR